MRFLLDTGVLIWILRGNQEVVKKVQELSKGEKQAISLLSVAEIYENIYSSEREQTNKLLQAHKQFSLNWEIVQQAGLFWKKYREEVKALSLIDCLIVATAEYYQLQVLTCNTKHFPMKEIKIVNPLD